MCDMGWLKGLEPSTTGITILEKTLHIKHLRAHCGTHCVYRLISFGIVQSLCTPTLTGKTTIRFGIIED